MPPTSSNSASGQGRSARPEAADSASDSRTQSPLGQPASGQVQKWVVGEEFAGQRIDNFLLARLKGVPKTRVYRMLRTGEVRVNGGRIASDYRLEAEDVLRIPPVRLAHGVQATAQGQSAGRVSAPRAHAIAHSMPVVYEDENFLAISKPVGLAVHGGSGVSMGVIEALRQHRAGQPALYLELVHRLDRETSGLMLVAKRRSALTEFHRQLREGVMRKRYLALVWGSWPAATDVIDQPLHKWVNPKGERWVRVQADGQAAITRVTCLQRVEAPGLGPISLLRCEPVTGRTHQLRVHLKFTGYPIVGDPKYGDEARDNAAKSQGVRRMFLHAWQLRCQDPKTQQTLHLTADPDAMFNGFLEQLGIHAP